MKSSIIGELKGKKLLFAHWRAEDKQDCPYQNWHLPLKKLFNNIITFDPAKNYFRYGKEEMNRMFLEFVKKEKPDYIFFMLLYDEFHPETFLKIKEISPNSITINLFADDDSRYEDFTRCYILFFDYAIVGVAKENILAPHTKDGIKGITLSHDVNCDIFKPIKVEKKYGVGFYGRANNSRAALIEYLIKERIPINVWGDGWSKYPALREHHRGFLNAEDIAKTINETKINLCFTMGGYGKPNFKGRVVEIGACKSFVLLEYYKGYKEYFKEGKEIVMFKDKKDLVKKIKYYLKHEGEREKIAKNLYKKVIKKHNQDIMLRNFFAKLLKKEKKKIVLPKINKKVAYLSEKDLLLRKKEILNKVKVYDYVCFSKNNAKILNYREYLQAYSLDKSKKDISCCDYYVNSKSLGNYLLFKSKVAFLKNKKETFDFLVDPVQLMLDVKYFRKNFDKIIEDVKKGRFTLINENNVVFVSIPLLEYPKVHNTDYKSMSFVYQMKFLDKLYSLYYQKRLFFSSYPYLLFLRSIANDKFIIKSLIDNITNKDKIRKIIQGI